MSSSPPSKRKKHVASKFQPEWKRFRLSASKKGPSFAFCTVCGVDFAIAGGGVKRRSTNGEAQALAGWCPGAAKHFGNDGQSFD